MVCMAASMLVGGLFWPVDSALTQSESDIGAFDRAVHGADPAFRHSIHHDRCAAGDGPDPCPRTAEDEWNSEMLS